ncbi:unnamed protein product [Symbiodinium sp. CCMP2592]|nr:unnamed protein product [Symbiodinium sp. CCMP2592]
MTLLFFAFVNASTAFVKGLNFKVQEAVVQQKALQKDLLKKKTEFLDHVPALVTALLYFAYVQTSS